MRDLWLTVEARKKPKYQALADGLRLAIRQGKIKPGEPLPSSRELARRFKMHRHTVMAALGELEAEGWLTPLARRFYQVTDTLPDKYLRPRFVDAPRSVKSLDTPVLARTLPFGDYDAQTQYRHSFPSGFPDVRLFPMAEFKSHLYDSFKTKNVLSYGDPAGHPQLISEVERYLRRVRSVKDRHIVVTNGSQEAIFLLAQCLIGPGDNVAVEALGYPPAFEALRFAGGNLIPVEVDREGICVDSLERILKKKKIKLLYTTPLHQYPTTVTLSASRRLKLVELAAKYGFFILEDDYDHEFHYVSQPVAPLASFDPEGLILYVSTFSKVLFPAARVGFMAVPQNIGREVAKLKRISSRQNEQILQLAIARWMASGGFERHLRRMRRVYEDRRNALVAELRKIQSQNPRLNWLEPDGGMALWLDLGQNSSTFARGAKARSVLVTPEQAFRVDHKEGCYLRLGFSGFTPAENKASLDALF